jgi:hypothetical protein
MKKRFKMIAAITIMAIALGSAAVWAMDYDVPDHASTKTARFNVMEDMDAPGVEFSMISEDGELVIHIAEDTLVYFEDYVPLGDEEDAGMTRDAREVLFGRTLAEVLDGRNLTVTYAVTTRSIPPQTTPISVMILFEIAVPLPIDIDDTHTIEVHPSVVGDMPFTDVFADDWYHVPIMWAFENGIMNGISETEFAPSQTTTRAMLVTVLWRYAGQPQAAAAHTFADVADGNWYSEAVAWAAENDIVRGFSETVFGTSDNITRAQLYTILYRYMHFMGLDIELEEEMRLRQFADTHQVEDWALDALHFMFDAGVMFRYSSLDNYARPNEDATRGEIAGAMYFFDMRVN